MKKVLIIDDDPNLVELIQLRLEHNEYEIKSASNGVEGFAVAMDYKPNVIILDVSMPTMDGHTFVKEIKWRPELKDIPVLVLTGKDQTEELFKEEGVDNFMTKPFDSKALVDKVAELAGN